MCRLGQITSSMIRSVLSVFPIVSSSGPIKVMLFLFADSVLCQAAHPVFENINFPLPASPSEAILAKLETYSGE